MARARRTALRPSGPRARRCPRAPGSGSRVPMRRPCRRPPVTGGCARRRRRAGGRHCRALGRWRTGRQAERHARLEQVPVQQLLVEALEDADDHDLVGGPLREVDVQGTSDAAATVVQLGGGPARTVDMSSMTRSTSGSVRVGRWWRVPPRRCAARTRTSAQAASRSRADSAGPPNATRAYGATPDNPMPPAESTTHRAAEPSRTSGLAAATTPGPACSSRAGSPATSVFVPTSGMRQRPPSSRRPTARPLTGGVPRLLSRGQAAISRSGRGTGGR